MKELTTLQADTSGLSVLQKVQQTQEDQLSGWQFSPWKFILFTMGYNGKYHPLTGYHPKQPQAQKATTAAKLPGVPSWRSHGIFQGTRTGETRGAGHRNIDIKESSSEAGYIKACFYLYLFSTWKWTLGVWHSFLCADVTISTSSLCSNSTFLLSDYQGPILRVPAPY